MEILLKNFVYLNSLLFSNESQCKVLGVPHTYIGNLMNRLFIKFPFVSNDLLSDVVFLHKNLGKGFSIFIINGNLIEKCYTFDNFDSFCKFNQQNNQKYIFVINREEMGAKYPDCGIALLVDNNKVEVIECDKFKNNLYMFA